MVKKENEIKSREGRKKKTEKWKERTRRAGLGDGKIFRGGEEQEP